MASVVSNDLILAANPSLPSVTDFRGFIALARDARPPLFYASIGNGSEHHLAMELLKQQAGIDLVHVPYRGGGPAAIGVMAGEVYPGYEVTIWQGLFAPIGTPPAIVAQPDIVEKLAAAGSGDPYVTTLAELAARIRSDHARYGKLIKDIGLAVD